MMTLNKQQTPSFPELELTPVDNRCKFDDSDVIVSMPNGYCYLYALCDYLGLIDYRSVIPSRSELIGSFFDYCMRIDVATRILLDEPEISYIIRAIYHASSNPAVDIVDDFLGINTYEEYIAFGPKNNSRYIIATNLDGSHHMYVNPKGHLINPTYISYSLVGRGRGGRRGGNNNPPRRRNNRGGGGGRNRNQVAQAPRRRQQAQNRNNRSNWKKRLAYGAADIATSFMPEWAARPANAMAHAAIDRISGRGDYQIKSAGSNTMKDTGPPSFASPTAATRIKHREYIGDISSTTAFTCTRYVIQPGVNSLFPWLNVIAANFEQYRLMGMVIEFKSLSAEAIGSTSTALGVVGITTQYDTAEANFTTKSGFENYVGTQSAKPSQSLLHYVECAKSQNPTDIKYIRTATLPTGADAHEYDFGWVCVMTTGMQASSQILGELWVSYDVELLKPRTGATLQLTAGNTSTIDVFRGSVSSYGATTYCLGGNGVIKSPSYYGNMGSYTQGNKFVLPVTSNAPAGRYMLSCFWNSASNTNYGTGNFTLTGCVPVNFFNEGSEPYQYSPYPNINSTTNKANLSSSVVFDWDRNNDAVVNFVGFNAVLSSKFTLVVRSIPIMDPNPSDDSSEPHVYNLCKSEDEYSDASEEQKEHDSEPIKALRKARPFASPAMEEALQVHTVETVETMILDKEAVSATSKQKKKK